MRIGILRDIGRRFDSVGSRRACAALTVCALLPCGCASSGVRDGARAGTERVELVSEIVRVRPEPSSSTAGRSEICLTALQTDEKDGENAPFDLVFPEEELRAPDPVAPPNGGKEPTADSPATAEAAEEMGSGITPLPHQVPEPDAKAIEEAASPATPVSALVARAVVRSPSVQAARHRAAAAAQQITQMRSYDDPRLGTTYAPIDSNSLQTAGGRIPLSLTLSQSLPWRDKLDVRGQVAADEARRLSVLAVEAELKVALDVELAAADLWYADAAIEVARSDRTVLTSLEEVAKARVRSGASQQDVLSARLEADRLDNRIAGLHRLRGVAVARLAALLGEPPSVTNGIRIDLPDADESGDVEQLIDAAIACRPELKSLLFAVRRDRHKRRLACLDRYPDFDVGVGWQSVTRDEAISPVANGHDNVNLMVGVTLPVRHGRIDAGIREAEQQIFASSREYDAGVDAVRRDVFSAAVRLETLGEQLRLHEETLLPRSQQVLDVSLADYRGGKVTFVQVTQNYLAVLALRTEAARLRAERTKAAAELRRAIGCEQPASDLLNCPPAGVVPR